jgi:hypothetical protein
MLRWERLNVAYLVGFVAGAFALVSAPESADATCTGHGLDCEPVGTCGLLCLAFDPSFDAEDCPPQCGRYFEVRVQRR